MNSLLGEIWKSISNTLRNEELHPKKENLRVREHDRQFTIEIRRRFLWIFHAWVGLCEQNDKGEQEPILFNTVNEAIEFITEITK